MKQSRFNLYLAGTIFILSVAPVTASFFLVDELLDSAISFGVNRDMERLLEAYQRDLKRLHTLDPAGENQYKRRFERVSDKLLLYRTPDQVQATLRKAYLTYYAVFFGGILLASLGVSILIGRKLSRSYDELRARDVAREKRLQQLDHFREWSQVARKLAHEIRNTLTPIEVGVSSLARSYEHANADEFASKLKSTRNTVDSQIRNLRAMIEHFSRFSKLPEPDFKVHNLRIYIQDFIEQYRQVWPSVALEDDSDSAPDAVPVSIDPALFTQCLVNMINNAAEANAGSPRLRVRLQCGLRDDETVQLTVADDGVGIDPETVHNMFKIYYTTRRSGDNLGLGLPIVKKILLDHGGDIDYVESPRGAAFRIVLPRAQESA